MRYQEENNVRYFDLHVHGLHGVPIRLERNSGLCVCVLEVPGLAKSRPSVLKGDHLYTKESGVIAARLSTRAPLHSVLLQMLHEDQLQAPVRE